MAVVSMSAALGDKETEKEYCERIVTKGGASADLAGQAYCNLGVLCEGQDEEIGYYEKSIQLKPGAFAPMYSLACAHAARQHWSQAVQSFHQAAALAADKDEKLMALKNLYRCACAIVQSDPAAATASPQDMLARLQQEMGLENFELLTQLTKRA